MKNTDWHVEYKGSFFEVLPDDDTKEHLLGDECWCKPKVQRSVRPNKYLRNTPFEIPGHFDQPVIVHNSHDKREIIPKNPKINISEPLQ